MSKKRQEKKARQKARHERGEEELHLAAGEIAEKDVPEIAGAIEEDAEEKHFAESPVVPGPTSFEEMDVMREEEDKLWKIQDVTWDARQIVSNIFSDRDKGTGEKVSAIKKMADAFGDKVDDIMSGKKDFGLNPSGEFDPEIAEVELLYREATKDFSIGRIFESLTSHLKTANKELEDKDYAHITKEGERILPLHDRPHIEKALAFVLSNLKYNGADIELAKELRSKVLAASRNMGVGMPSEKKLTGIVVQKGLDNIWRWMGWVSNNFKDREEEILTEKGHTEYIEYLNANPDAAPEFRVWHVKGTHRKSKADWWSYTNGFLLMSGALTEKEAGALLLASEKEDLGMSHGFYVLQRNPNNQKHIDMYRTYEVSDLPLRFAANPFTNIEAIFKEATMTENLNQLDHLLNYMNKEDADRLLEQTAKAGEILAEAGIANKEIEPDESSVATPEADPQKLEGETVQSEKEAPSGDDTPEASAGKALEQLVKTIGDAYKLNELSEWAKEVNKTLAIIPEIHDLLTKTNKSQDKQIAEAITPPIANTFGWERSSQSKDTELGDSEEDAKLKEDAPGKNGWFAQAAGG